MATSNPMTSNGNPMSKGVSSHDDEIKNIREDLNSLKHNVVGLTETIRKEVVDTASKQFVAAKKHGRKVLSDVEKDVKQKPMQSLAMAFGAGVILSFLLRKH